MAELTRSTRSIVPQTRYDNDAHERVQVKVKVSKFKTTFFLFSKFIEYRIISIWIENFKRKNISFRPRFNIKIKNKFDACETNKRFFETFEHSGVISAGSRFSKPLILFLRGTAST